MAQRKVIPYKKQFHPNLTFFLFLLIILYILVMAWGFFAKPQVSIYEVNATNISDDAPLYGFIMRAEEIVNTEETGFVNYYFSEGSRIGKGDVAYTTDGDGTVSKYLEQIQSKQDNSESITKMREVISSFYSSFNMSSYNEVNRLKYDTKNVIFDINNGSLYSDLEKALFSAGGDKNFAKVKAKKSGVIAYTIDGYETTRQQDITPELFDEYGSVVRRQLQTNTKVETGSPVYKVVTSNDWSLIVKLDDSYYKALQEKKTVRVTILKDNISFNGAVELFDSAGTHFAKLTTSRYMERYINDRFLKIEFNLKSATGLKIPNSSILEKELYEIPTSVITKNDNGIGVVCQKTDENGKTKEEFVSLKNSFLLNDVYYVQSSVLHDGDILYESGSDKKYVVSNKKKLQGVYYVNKGYCQFRPIELLYKNKEYTIISANTNNGLSVYDHIIVEPDSLSDDDFIQ